MESTDVKRLKKTLNGFRHAVMTWLYMVDTGKADIETAEKVVMRELLPEVQWELHKVFRMRR